MSTSTKTPEDCIIVNEITLYSYNLQTFPIVQPIAFYCWDDTKLKNINYNFSINNESPYFTFELEETDINNHSLRITKNSNLPYNILPFSCDITINFNLTFLHNNEDLIKRTNFINYKLKILKPIVYWRIIETSYNLVYRSGSTQMLPNNEILLNQLPNTYTPNRFNYTGYLQLQLYNDRGFIVKILESWTTRNGLPIKYFNEDKIYEFEYT